MTPNKNQQTTSRIQQWLCAMHWGGRALISLYISVLSGIVLALQYNDYTPFYSTATIELVVPYGSFWRALHYFSSQAFFLLLLVHLGMILWQNEYRFTRSAWIRLSTSIPVALLLLFTGYVLRGDATGEAAGAIAEHIALSIPLLGKPLNHFLFDIQASGMTKVYAQHLIGLMVAGGICIWPHLRRYTANFKNHILLILLIAGISVYLSAPMEPDHIGLLHIAGPWFFLGLQELLRTIPPFWAGVVLPLTVVAPLLLLPFKGQSRKRWLVFMVLWLVLYAAVTSISYKRVHSDNTTILLQEPAATSPLDVQIPDSMK
jgi:ubiquinol-cytochrome c reductase cytochrome b subunit